MAGLPPFNGFLSKELFFNRYGQCHRIWNLPFGNMGNFFTDYWLDRKYFYLCYTVRFFSSKRLQANFNLKSLSVKHVHEAPIGMLISPMILGSIGRSIRIIPESTSLLLD